MDKEKRIDPAEEVKEDLKQFHLKTIGTLEETEDFYSFEDGWERFESALKCAFNTPKPSKKRKKQ